MSQISFFDGSQPLKITKPIRLIECFAGYGSQALALKYLGVDFEHWKIAEWAVKSIQAYKDMHFPDDNTDYSKEHSKEWLIDYLFEKGISADYNKPMTREQIARMGEVKIRRVYNNIIATNNLVSVINVNGEDLKITDTDDYTYILTYSFPCQDLSQTGLSKGMQKGSGTRSGLLWEIERILDECDELPQILLMENVPQVIGEKNRDAFRDWFMKLESLGYKSWYTIMNGKDYEIPQNRERCFMVSALGDYYYDFPTPKPLELRWKDMLEAEVDEKYYLSNKTVEMFLKHTEKKQAQGCGFKFEPTDGEGVGKCISTRAGSRTDDNFIKDYAVINLAHVYFDGSIKHTDVISTIDTGVGNWHTLIGEPKCKQVGKILGSGYNEMTGRVYSSNGLCPTVRTFCGGGQEIKIAEDEPRFYDYYNKTEISGEYCGTITSCSAHNVSGTFLVSTKEKADLLLTIFDLCGIIKEQEENQYESSRNLLSILWKEIGKKEVQRSIRRFWSLQKKEVLQPRVYENGNVENRGLQSEISPSSSNCGEYYEKLQIRKKMLNMWENWKVRYTPQRWELSKQQFDKFNIFMSQLSYETTSGEESMQNLRTTDESIRILQQTLYSLQKIWRPELHKEQNEYRIRKLTPKEAFRLMGVKDEDFERVVRNQSNSSLYHLAGDSIITNCLMAIFKEML